MTQGHKIYTVVSIGDDGDRREQQYKSLDEANFAATLCRSFGYETWIEIEEDWLDPNISY